MYAENFFFFVLCMNTDAQLSLKTRKIMNKKEEKKFTNIMFYSTAQQQQQQL